MRAFCLFFTSPLIFGRLFLVLEPLIFASSFVLLQQPPLSPPSSTAPLRSTSSSNQRISSSSSTTTTRLFVASKKSLQSSSTANNDKKSSPKSNSKVKKNAAATSSNGSSKKSKTVLIPSSTEAAKISRKSSSTSSNKKPSFPYLDSLAATFTPPPLPTTTPTTQTPSSSYSTNTPVKNDKRFFDDDLLSDEEPYDIATRLLGLVLQRREDEVDRSFDTLLRRLTPSYWSARRRQAQRIESLIELIQDLGDVRKNERKGLFGSIFGNDQREQRRRAVHTYDPSTCLIGGGFFCTMYFYTPNDPNAPDPLWEQLSFKRGNIKGQQYYERNDFQEGVINYSEVWGPDLYITAEGTFKPVDFVTPKVATTTTTTTTTRGTSSKSSPGISWPSFGDKAGQKDTRDWEQQAQSDRTIPGSRTLRSCPDIFQVDATSGAIHCETLGIQIPLPIVGSSNLVVVYADPRLRILLSPTSSESVVGNWEESGLVVVQVRSDLALSGDDLRERWVRRRSKDGSNSDIAARRDFGYEGGSLDFR